VLRGLRFNLYAKPPRYIKLSAAVLLPAVALWYAAWADLTVVHWLHDHPLAIIPAYAAAAVLLWYATHGLLLLGNVLVHNTPRARRAVRPWLRHHGLHLLPPRRRRRKRRRGQAPAPEHDAAIDEEILEIHERHQV